LNMDPLVRVLNASNRMAPDASLETTLLVLLLAFVLGQLVAWTYMWTHTGLSYSRTFTQAMVLMTRDTVFVFVALVVGMAVGTQRFFTAIAGTIALALTAFYLSKTSFGTPGHFDGYLTLRFHGDPNRWSGIEESVKRFCRRARRISARQTGEDDTREVVFRVGLRDRNRSGELIEELKSIQGVETASLVLRDELYEV